MPTHFHFLVFVKPIELESERQVAVQIDKIKRNIGVMLSSYTKAINSRYRRHGSLFQLHTKARPVTSERYLSTLVTYIHQNPVRARLAKKPEDWEYSSYQDYIGVRKDDFLRKEIILSDFVDIQALKSYSEELLQSVQEEYWV